MDIINSIGKYVFLPLVTIIIGAIGKIMTNKITNHVKKEEYEIRVKQFHQVYLPLYKSIFDDQPKKLSLERAYYIYDKIKNITHTQFKYTYHNLIKINNNFKNYLDKNYENEYQRYFAFLKDNIEQDYKKLARILRYPYESKFRTLIRGNAIEKLYKILILIYVPYLIFLFVVLINKLQENPIINEVIVYMTILLFLLAILIVIFASGGLILYGFRYLRNRKFNKMID